MMYVVCPGDSLYRVATRQGFSVEELVKTNNLIRKHLYIGQKLQLPTPLRIYTIKRNDTLYRIAARFEVSVGDLIHQNPILQEKVPIIGQNIRIPQAKTPVINHLQHESLHHTIPYPDEETLIQIKRARDEYITIQVLNGIAAFVRPQRGVVSQRDPLHAQEFAQVQEALRLQGCLAADAEKDWAAKGDALLHAEDFPDTWAALAAFQKERQLDWWAKQPVFEGFTYVPDAVYPNDLTTWALRYFTRYYVQLEDARSELHNINFCNMPVHPSVHYPLGVSYTGQTRHDISPEKLMEWGIPSDFCAALSELIPQQLPFDAVSSAGNQDFSFGFMGFTGKLLTRFLVHTKLEHPALFEILFARLGIEVEYSWHEEEISKAVLMLITPESRGAEYVYYDHTALKQIQRDKQLQAAFIRAGLHPEIARFQVLTFYRECVLPSLQSPQSHLHRPEKRKDALLQLLRHQD